MPNPVHRQPPAHDPDDEPELPVWCHLQPSGAPTQHYLVVAVGDPVQRRHHAAPNQHTTCVVTYQGNPVRLAVARERGRCRGSDRQIPEPCDRGGGLRWHEAHRHRHQGLGAQQPQQHRGEVSVGTADHQASTIQAGQY